MHLRLYIRSFHWQLITMMLLRFHITLLFFEYFDFSLTPRPHQYDFHYELICTQFLQYLIYIQQLHYLLLVVTECMSY